MKISKTNFEGLIYIQHNSYKDNRGSFTETFRNNILQDFLGFDTNFCQSNRVESNINVLRGLHFQELPYAQSKLISVSQGKILDIAVDLRKKSKTYSKYYSCILSSNLNNSLFIPKGFAHGYLTLENNTIVNYMVDEYYNIESEKGIRYNDPNLKIDWGINHDNIIISEKDSKYENYKW